MHLESSQKRAIYSIFHFYRLKPYFYPLFFMHFSKTRNFANFTRSYQTTLCKSVLYKHYNDAAGKPTPTPNPYNSYEIFDKLFRDFFVQKRNGEKVLILSISRNALFPGGFLEAITFCKISLSAKTQNLTPVRSQPTNCSTIFSPWKSAQN